MSSNHFKCNSSMYLFFPLKHFFPLLVELELEKDATSKLAESSKATMSLHGF